MFQVRVNGHKFLFRVLLHRNSYDCEIATLLQMFPEQSSTESSIMTRHRLAVDGHVSVSSQWSQFLIQSLAALQQLLLRARNTFAAVPKAEQQSVQHHDPAVTLNGRFMFQYRVIRHSSSFRFSLHCNSSYNGIATLLQLSPEQNKNQSSIVTLHSLSMDESCFHFESTITVPHSDSYCTATAVAASSQHCCSCPQSGTAISPAS
jgi:hypothetical protein